MCNDVLSDKVKMPSLLEAEEMSLASIQKLPTEVQDTVGVHLKTSFQLTSNEAELKNSVERNRQEVTNLKQELVKQNKYVATSEKELPKPNGYIKQHTCMNFKTYKLPLITWKPLKP